MKIVRMWDREERYGHQFAMVETVSFFFFKKKRRIGRLNGNTFFAFMDNGKYTHGNDAEVMWTNGTERNLTDAQARAARLQAAYLVGCDNARE